jgi:hypothetical protein
LVAIAVNGDAIAAIRTTAAGDAKLNGMLMPTTYHSSEETFFSKLSVPADLRHQFALKRVTTFGPAIRRFAFSVDWMMETNIPLG